MAIQKRWIGAAVAGITIAVTAVGMTLAPPGGSKSDSLGTSRLAQSTKLSEPIVVTTDLAKILPIQRSVAIVGSLYGREEVAVSAKVDGTVYRIHHDVGDVVKSGDVLLELDTTDAQLAVNEAQRGLELELAKMGLLEPPQTSFDVASLPTVMRTAAKLEYATAKRERLTPIESTSPDERQQAEYEVRDAKEAHRQAKLDAETTLAAIRQRQATLETTRQRLKDTRILAPSPGTDSLSGPVSYLIAQRTASEGEIVRPGSTTLFRLVIADSLKLQAAITERHFGEIKVGQVVDARVEAFPKDAFPGNVSRVNPTVDRASRTFQVEITIPNSHRRLAPGSFAKADIRTRHDPDAVMVPEESLVLFAGVTKVFVIRDGSAKAIVVRPTDVRVDGGRLGLLAEIKGDVHPGDHVVTSGQTKLSDGTAVSVRNETQKDSAK